LLYIVVTVAVFSLWTASAAAQELAPRAYWPAPNGTNLLVVGYQYSSGDVVIDPTLPLSGADSTINYVQVTYQHTLSLFDRTANLQFNLPYAWGTTTGDIEGEFRRRDLSAFGDARMLLSVNLRGAPSMDAAGFQALRAEPRTIIGASILVQPPTGAYEPDKVINTGTNRWAFKLATGVIWPVRPRWLVEADVGAWFFTDNDEFLGTTRQQDPIYSAEFHLVRRVKPGFWASLDLNFYVGGQTTVGQDLRADLQRNSRFGGTVVIPFKGRHVIRTSYSTGIVTNSGGDYETFSLNYAYVW
jgi:hypothetical protein